jgi:hypothetical protein
MFSNSSRAGFKARDEGPVRGFRWSRCVNYVRWEDRLARLKLLKAGQCRGHMMLIWLKRDCHTNLEAQPCRYPAMAINVDTMGEIL